MNSSPTITLSQAQQKLAETKQLLKEEKYREACVISEEIAPILQQAQQWEDYIFCLDLQFSKMNVYGITDAKAQKLLAQLQELSKLYLNNDSLLKANVKLRFCIFYANCADNNKALTEAKLLLQQQIKLHGEDASIVYKIKSFICHLYSQINNASPEAIQFIQQFNEQLSANLAKNQNTIIRNYMRLGRLFVYVHPIKAIQYLNKAVELTLPHKNLENFRSTLGDIYRTLGVLYFEQKDYDSALEYSHKALDIDLSFSYTHNITAGYMNIGNCYLEKKQWETGIIYLKKAEKLSKGNKGMHGIHLYSSFAKHYLVTQKLEEAEKYAQKVLAICETLAIKRGLALALSYEVAGAVCLGQKKYQKAINFFKQGKIALKGEVVTEEAHSYLCSINDGIAKGYFLQKKYALSFKQLQNNLGQLLNEKKINKNNYHYTPAIQSSSNNSVLLNTLLLKAQYLQAYYNQSSQNIQDLQKSIFTYQLADKTLLEIRDNLLLENSKLSLSHQAEELYKDAITASITAMQFAQKNESVFLQNANKIIELNQQHYPKKKHPYTTTNKQAKALAFEFCEKSKGLILLDNLVKNKAKVTSNIDPNITKKETDLLAEMHLLNHQIQQIKNEFKSITENNTTAKDEKITQLTGLEITYANYKQQYEAVLATIEEKYPQYHQIKHQRNVASIEQLQSQLNEQQALINYYIGESSLYVFVITTITFKVFTVAKPLNMEKLISKLHKAMNHLNFHRFVQISHQLYQLLLAPIQQQLAIQNIHDLIIIPHKKLSILPFEALLTHDAKAVKSGSFHQLPYLINQYNISYHYSASLWLQNISSSSIQQAIPTTDGFVGFAPVYADADNEGNELSQPDSTTTEVSVSALHQMPQAAVRSVRIGDMDFSELIYSEEELKGIENLFQKQNIPTQTYFHQKASLEQLKRVVKNKKYIHIAAHGYEETENKEMVGIILSPNKTNNEKASTKASILFLNDTYTLQLDADLVVLSCCKSGIGTIAAGEGMMAMNRGFLYAGAKNVLYTLFKVYDKASSDLTQHFFQQHLQAKQSYTHALRQAKLKMIAQPQYTPKHWAGFVLIGV